MALIEAIDGSELTEYVIKLLNKNKIKTIIEFLEFDTNKLCKIINLTAKQIGLLKEIIIKKHGAVLRNAGDAYVNTLNRKFPALSTDIKSLDNLLGGNLTNGQIIEICGLPGIGKSLLCTTLCVNSFLQNHQLESIYIDTKKDFSASRVHKILLARGCQIEDIGKIMQSIRVERVYSAADLVQILCNLLEFFKANNKVKLLIIDSLPAVWFLFHGDESGRGVYLLNKTAMLLRRLANEYELVVVVVNIITRWIDMDLEGNTNTDKSQTYITKPSLGKFWETVPTTRLCMEDPVLCKDQNCSVCVLGATNSRPSNSFSIRENITNHTEGMNCRRLIKIMKSCLCKTDDHCFVNLSAAGIH